MSSVQVAVRVRPFNKREISRESECIIQMEGNTTTIAKPGVVRESPKTFKFDHSYWSHNPDDVHFAKQERVYMDLGENSLEHSIEGYNVCILAYGQTGAGKSYSMMGQTSDDEQQGIIPRFCLALFSKMEDLKLKEGENFQFSVEVSYMEIYCERVRDLLNPRSKSNLRVREHPSLGPYVEDLSKSVVTSFDDINDLIDAGNKSRTVAATNMNETSSRSHAVFTLVLRQQNTLSANQNTDDSSNMTGEKVSKISLVDLAGSERADSTGAKGTRLKEGANINKSLTTLGKVISALAEQSSMDKSIKKKKKSDFIPFRDSVLTWLLRENLGGNSRTTMLVAISPADINYDETLSSLRYADRAKQIVCQAVVNEDPTARMIRELREEVGKLRDILRLENIQVGEGLGGIPDVEMLRKSRSRKSGEVPDVASSEVVVDMSQSLINHICDNQDLLENLRASEKLIAELNETYDEKLTKTECLKKIRDKELAELGITLKEDGGAVGVFSSRNRPNLVNLNEDPLMSECLVYYLKDGETKVGRPELENTERKMDIHLSGDFIRQEHCIFHFQNGEVMLDILESAECYVNGIQVMDKVALKNKDRVILGKNHVFRFADPLTASQSKASMTVKTGQTDEILDWNFATTELWEKQGVDLRQEMNRRLMVLEDQFKKEKEEADRVFEKQKKEYESRIESLQKQVDRVNYLATNSDDYLSDDEMNYDPIDWTEREYQLAAWAFNKWRHHQYTSLRDFCICIQPAWQIKDELWANTVLLKEANSISQELNKKVVFQFALQTETPYSPSDIVEGISSSNATANKFSQASLCTSSSNLNDANTVPEYQGAPSMSTSSSMMYVSGSSYSQQITGGSKTRLVVEVRDYRNGAVHYWSLQKFRKRLEEIREMYQNEVDIFDSSGPLADKSQQQHQNQQQMSINSSSTNLSMNSQIESITGGDPFYDRFPWFQLVGRSFVFLSNLHYNVPLIHRVAIVSGDGEVRGFLRVAVQPIGVIDPDAPLADEEQLPVPSPLPLSPSEKRQHNMPSVSDEMSTTPSSKTNINKLHPCAHLNFEDAPYFAHQKQTIAKGCTGVYDREDSTNNSETKSAAGVVVDVDKTPSKSSSQKTETDRDKKETENGQNYFFRDNTDTLKPLTQNNESNTQDFLKEGCTLYFRVTVLQVSGLSSDYTDTFCQYSFLNQPQEVFSTEPLKNIGKTTPIGYYHVQNFSVQITKSFLDYSKNFAIRFELFSHQEARTMPFSGLESVHLEPEPSTNNRRPSTFTQPSAISPTTSQPIISQRDDVIPSSVGVEGLMLRRYDLLVWFEIMELSPNGEYVPVPVDHTPGKPGGIFRLRQGLQRRFAVTIVHEPTAAIVSESGDILPCVEPENNDQNNGLGLIFHSVREMVVGRVRDRLEVLEYDDYSKILSLNLLPAHYLTNVADERIMFRFESAWDSSLHESALLNTLTQSNDVVYITISCYVDVEGCIRPVCLTKDLCMVVTSRDSQLSIPRSLKSFIGSFYKSPDINRVTGIYDLQLKQIINRGPVRKPRRVASPQNPTGNNNQQEYVRGEENLPRGWRPRSDSLILEHQWQLEKLTKLQTVQKVRHVLLLREKLAEKGRTMEIELLDDEARREQQRFWEARSKRLMTAAGNNNTEDSGVVCPGNNNNSKNKSDCSNSNNMDTSSSDAGGGMSSTMMTSSLIMMPSDAELLNEEGGREKLLKSRCLELMSSSGTTNSTTSRSVTTGKTDSSAPVPQMTMTNSTHQDSSQYDVMEVSVTSSHFSSASASVKNKMIGECDEIRISPVVSKKGYLLLLEESKPATWARRFVVVRRPFLYIYGDERDPVERGIINLATAQIQYTGSLDILGGGTTGCEEETNKDNSEATPMFSLVFPHRTWLVQTLSAEPRHVHDWLYAFNPLLAGQIRSKMGRKKKNHANSTTNKTITSPESNQKN